MWRAASEGKVREMGYKICFAIVREYRVKTFGSPNFRGFGRIGKHPTKLYSGGVRSLDSNLREQRTTRRRRLASYLRRRELDSSRLARPIRRHSGRQGQLASKRKGGLCER